MIKLKKVILWSKKNEIKTIDFKTDGITLLIGKSKTGKSSIISIIDYCLASSTCEIPVGVIRDSCSWFGIILSIDGSDILLARKSPINTQKSDDMYFEKIANDSIPIMFEANRTRDEIRNYFNEIFNITNLEIDLSTYTEYVPSFRDAIAINFFPQNLLLDKKFYFYKQNDRIHKRNFDLIFPYVMELISMDEILYKHQIDELKRMILILERNKEKNKEVINQWEQDSKEKVLSAMKYGLLNCSEVPVEFNDRIRILKTINEDSFVNRIDTIKNQIYNVNKELIRLENLQEKLYSEISEVSRKLRLIKTQTEKINEYDFDNQKKQLSKKVTEWMLNDEYLKRNILTVNDSYSFKMYNMILSTLKNEEKNVNFYRSYRISLDKEYLENENKYNFLLERLKNVTEIIEANSNEKNDLAENKTYLFGLYSFYGELKNFIEIYSIMNSTDEIEIKLYELNQQIDLIKAKMNPEKKKENYLYFETFMNSTLDTVLDTLNVEHKNDKIYFDAKKIEFIFRINDTNFSMESIGSGSNYMEYHIAMALLLQIYIQNKVREKKTFDFLVFDQPSETYFPTDERNKKNALRESSDNDAISLKNVYRTISNIRKSHCKNLQIIVLEHADAEYWKDNSGMLFDKEMKIINWKEIEGQLIPNEWLK